MSVAECSDQDCECHERLNPGLHCSMCDRHGAILPPADDVRWAGLGAGLTNHQAKVKGFPISFV